MEYSNIDSLKINIAGDFCATNRIARLLSEGKDILSHELAILWKDADVRIANLESPITDSNKKILKSGPHIKAPTSIKNGLGRMGIDYFSLANNHIMDFGLQGLKDTIEIVKKIGSGFFGVVEKENFFDSVIIKKGHLKVGIASFTNKEFSLYSDYNGNGAIPIDIIYISELIERLKKQVNYIVIILHVGLYGNPLPSPDQRKFCRYLVRLGCSAVLCQHSHITGAFENYEGGLISYGQGSFAFDLGKKNSIWNEGYIINLEFLKNKFEYNMINIRQFDDEPQIRLQSEKENKLTENRFLDINSLVRNDTAFLIKWDEFVEQKRMAYLADLFYFNNKYIRKLFPNMDFSALVKKKFKIRLLNLIRNEEHSEIIKDILKNSIK